MNVSEVSLTLVLMDTYITLTKTRLNCVYKSLVPFLITFDVSIHVYQLHFYCVLSLSIIVNKLDIIMLCAIGRRPKAYNFGSNRGKREKDFFSFSFPPSVVGGQTRVLTTPFKGLSPTSEHYLHYNVIIL